jgi:hypothetical protein
MRVTSLASSIANFGEMVGLVSPTHESLVGCTFEELGTFPGHSRIIAKQGNVIELFYTPVWNSEYEYHNYMPSDYTTSNAMCQFSLDSSAVPILSAAAYAQYDAVSMRTSNITSTAQPFMAVMFGGSEEIPFYVEIDCNYEAVGLNIGQLASPSPYNSVALTKAQEVVSVLKKGGASAADTPTFGAKVLGALPKLVNIGTDLLTGNYLDAGVNVARGISDLLQ